MSKLQMVFFTSKSKRKWMCVLSKNYFWGEILLFFFSLRKCSSNTDSTIRSTAKAFAKEDTTTVPSSSFLKRIFEFLFFGQIFGKIYTFGCPSCVSSEQPLQKLFFSIYLVLERPYWVFVSNRTQNLFYYCKKGKFHAKKIAFIILKILEIEFA